MFKNVSSNNFSLDNVCYLLSSKEPYQDEIGNCIAGEIVELLCFCAEKPTYSNEFANAGQIGIKPQTTLVVDSESYCGQERVKYNDSIYSVYRIFTRDDGLTEIFLTKKSGDYYFKFNQY